MGQRTSTGTGAEPVIKEIEIDASPEVVFEFFVDPEKLARWLATEATLDPRPGGVCDMVHEGAPGLGPFHMRGEFLAVDHPKRVVFTWGFDEESVGVVPGGSTVEVTFTPTGTGTKVVLVHSGLSVEALAEHSGGWVEMLDRLRSAVSGS